MRAPQATLGQLTATVSHELHNPLGVIRTSTFVAHDGLNGATPRVQRALERIDRSVIRCDRIIDELLDFTRISGLETEPTPIDAWLDGALKEQALPAEITLRRDFGLAGTTAPGHPARGSACGCPPSGRASPEPGPGGWCGLVPPKPKML